MKFLNFFQKKNKKNVRRVADFYQDSVEKTGRDQIQKIVEKGLSFKVIVL